MDYNPSKDRIFTFNCIKGWTINKVDKHEKTFEEKISKSEDILELRSQLRDLFVFDSQ